MELHTIKFPHAEDYLQELSKKGNDVLASDPNIHQVKAILKEVSSSRIAIQKTGKAMRDTATAYSREVMDQERQLISIIEDEEKQLKAKKDDLEHYEKLDKNHHKLEPRKLELAGYEYEHEDVEELILMTETQFKKLVDNKKEVYLLKKEKELADKQKKIEIAQAVEDAKKEVRDEVKAEEAVIQKAKEVRENREAEISADDAFQKKLVANGYNEATDKFKVKDGVCTVYRIIATFTI